MSTRAARCEICEYWIDKSCRRYPPTVIASVYTDGPNENYGRMQSETHSSPDSEWPTTKPDDWCGEWQEKMTQEKADAILATERQYIETLIKYKTQAGMC